MLSRPIIYAYYFQNIRMLKAPIPHLGFVYGPRRGTKAQAP